MLYWMRVKVTHHPTISWEPGPWQHVRSSRCCRWPLAAPNSPASLRSSSIAFSDPFGRARSRTSCAQGHDSFLPAAGPGLFQLCRSRRCAVRIRPWQRFPQPSLRKLN